MSSFDLCTPTTCSIDQSIFKYRPSLVANSVFIAFFGVGFIFHLILGFKQKTWSFTICMLCGCAVEMIGYGGRLMMWENVFNFQGFIIQIVCITIAPVFFTASIYLTLYTSILHLGAQSRFSPKFYCIVFIICDVVSLILQSVGGAMSSNSQGSSQNGVNISLAGLSFQVLSLTIFIALSIDYAWAYLRNLNRGAMQNRLSETGYRVFLGFVTLATICIYTRCVYRIAELSYGYSGRLEQKEGLFIGLEGVLIVVSVFALCIGNPGLVYEYSPNRLSRPDSKKV